MQLSQIPAKISAIWASLATPTYVRPIPITTSTPGAASLDLGFPPICADPVAAGGIPPDMRDFNGAMQIITAWSVWAQAGGPIFYDPTFSSSYGGYMNGSMLANANTQGLFWISTVDNNTSDPDTGGANWVQFPPSSATPVTSFNTRIGAVVLTSADVVNALATNALANTKLALMAGNTVKMNNTGTGATPQDVSTINLWANGALAQMAAHTVKMNNTGSTANAQDVSTTNLWANGNLAQMSGLTVKSNLSGSTANAADNSIASFGAALVTQSLTNPGYVIFPGGYTRQWGQDIASLNEGSYTINFPVAFANACLGGSGVPINTNGDVNKNAFMQFTSATTTSITFFLQFASGSTSVDGLQWESWGH